MRNTFGDRQERAMRDYIETGCMLQYNDQKHAPKPHGDPPMAAPERLI